jgi:stage II sporulation protein R
MKLRIVICLVIAALTATVAISAGYLGASANTATEAYVPDNLIRLHVVANSDSELDQQIKYEVRDAILALTTRMFRDLTSVSEAKAVAESNLKDIERIAESVVASHETSYSVNAELGVFAFPTKVYGSVTLPEGNYEALRIVLGTGQGQNWWCVLFPPLCFINITSDDTTISADFPLLSEQVTNKSGEDDEGNNEDNQVKWTVKNKTSLSFIQLLTTPLSYFYNIMRK